MTDTKPLTAEEVPANNPNVIAELVALPRNELCDKLRGIYRMPVDDGLGPLNGSMEFERRFYTGPIMHAAAQVIEEATTAKLAAERERDEARAEAAAANGNYFAVSKNLIDFREAFGDIYEDFDGGDVAFAKHFIAQLKAAEASCAVMREHAVPLLGESGQLVTLLKESGYVGLSEVADKLFETVTSTTSGSTLLAKMERMEKALQALATIGHYNSIADVRRFADAALQPQSGEV